MTREYPILIGPTGVGKDTLAFLSGTPTATKGVFDRPKRHNDSFDEMNVRVLDPGDLTHEEFLLSQESNGNVPLFGSHHGLRLFFAEDLQRIVDNESLVFILNYKVQDEFLGRVAKAWEHIPNPPQGRPITVLTGEELNDDYHVGGLEVNLAQRADQDLRSRILKARSEARYLASKWYETQYVLINPPAFSKLGDLQTSQNTGDLEAQKLAYMQEPIRKLQAIRNWLNTPRDSHNHTDYLNQKLVEIFGMDYNGIHQACKQGQTVRISPNPEIVRQFLAEQYYGLRPTPEFLDEVVNNLQLTVSKISQTQDSIDVIVKDPPPPHSPRALDLKKAIQYILIQQFGYYNEFDEHRISFSLSDAPQLPYYNPKKVKEPIQVRFHFGEYYETWAETQRRLRNSKAYDSKIFRDLAIKIAKEKISPLHRTIPIEKAPFIIKPISPAEKTQPQWSLDLLDYAAASHLGALLVIRDQILAGDLSSATRARLTVLDYHQFGLARYGNEKEDPLNTNTIAGLLKTHGRAYEITKELPFKDVMFRAADTLDSIALTSPDGRRYLPRIKGEHRIAIPSIYTVIPFLEWCDRNSSTTKYRDLAQSHLDIVLKHLFKGNPLQKTHDFPEYTASSEKRGGLLENEKLLMHRTTARVIYGLSSAARFLQDPQDYVQRADSLVEYYLSHLPQTQSAINVARAYPDNAEANLDIGAELYFIQALYALAEVHTNPSKAQEYKAIAKTRHIHILTNHMSTDSKYPGTITDCISRGGKYSNSSMIGAEYVNLRLLFDAMPKD